MVVFVGLIFDVSCAFQNKINKSDCSVIYEQFKYSKKYLSMVLNF